MKLNINKIIFLLLASITLALSSITSTLSLLTENIYLEIMLFSLTFLTAFLLIKVRKKQPLWIQK